MVTIVPQKGRPAYKHDNPIIRAKEMHIVRRKGLDWICCKKSKMKGSELCRDDEIDLLYEKYIQDGEASDLIVIPSGLEVAASFKNDGDWRACRIWEGYFDASGILLRTILKERNRADSLIFPAFFNLRHAVEVALKWHIAYLDPTFPK